MRIVRVLVIEDSLTIRAILESLLGHHPDIQIIGLASDVEEAKHYLEERQPDVITLDLNLPGIDGMVFLEELAQGPHAPVLVVSSSTQDKSEKSKATIKAGAFACFDKARLVHDAPRFIKALRRAADERLKALGLQTETADA
jgi:two-component system chemotaxis response regulator CheB